MIPSDNKQKIKNTRQRLLPLLRFFPLAFALELKEDEVFRTQICRCSSEFFLEILYFFIVQKQMLLGRSCVIKAPAAASYFFLSCISTSATAHAGHGRI
jgi:hypothetical protein